jgi:NADP-dependent 3-hydroxy acid dehydrogenase YdfG
MTSRGGAVVTGAGGGLGARTSALLAGRGYTVHLTDLDADAARDTAARIGGAAFASGLDVRDPDACRAVAAATVAAAGGLDVWVNNAGVLLTGPAWDQDAATRRLMVEVNVLGLMNGTVAAVDEMRRTGRGHVVNVASLAGLVAVPGEAVYAGTKHAALGFSLSTQADLHLAGLKGIHISCVCPAGMWTPMLYDKLEDPGAALSFSGRLLAPEEVAEVIGRVLDRPRQVTAVPAWRGLETRLADAVPDLSLKALALFVAQGRRAQRKLLRDGVPGTPRRRSPFRVRNRPGLR